MRHFIECHGKVKKDDISLTLPHRVVCNLLYSRDELSFSILSGSDPMMFVGKNLVLVEMLYY